MVMPFTKENISSKELTTISENYTRKIISLLDDFGCDVEIFSRDITNETILTECFGIKLDAKNDENIQMFGELNEVSFYLGQTFDIITEKITKAIADEYRFKLKESDESNIGNHHDLSISKIDIKIEDYNISFQIHVLNI